MQATSDYGSLGVYAVRGEDRSVRILVINKHPSAAINATIALPALKKGEKAKVFSYGIPQDEAARTGEGSADVQQSTLTLQGSTLNVLTRALLRPCDPAHPARSQERRSVRSVVRRRRGVKSSG